MILYNYAHGHCAKICPQEFSFSVHKAAGAGFILPNVVYNIGYYQLVGTPRMHWARGTAYTVAQGLAGPIVTCWISEAAWEYNDALLLFYACMASFTKYAPRISSPTPPLQPPPRVHVDWATMNTVLYKAIHPATKVN